ncbi:MAG TPA: MFS transporter [Actinobacteria bacterium]|jgi:predicted MFS family arabinose efflux permease|nr:MFS transporter [Actinomycetota bacterium]
MATAQKTSRDLGLILLIQALRALLYGFASILIGGELAAAGYSDAKVGFVLSAMLAGFAVMSLAVGTRGDRIGRRRLYGGLMLVMAAAGTVFALTHVLWLLILAALTGTVSVEANESGPITSLEQAMIPHVAPSASSRIRAFARYNAVAYLAGSIGALAAGGPDLFRKLYPALPASERFLLAFPVIGVVCALLATRLSPQVESGLELTTERRFPLLESRKKVGLLSALFATDALGGGFVVNAFLVFWFHRRFGASTELMGVVFFVVGLLQSASSIAAGWVAARIGLLNTMVFTHLPSNVLLMLVPLMPTLPLAVVVLLARFAISQMDVPARQAYVVAMVEPGERTAAAAYTNTARYLARPISPTIGGVLMQNVAFGAPFVAGGALKIVYDLALLVTFKKVKLKDEPDPTPLPPSA